MMIWGCRLLAPRLTTAVYPSFIKGYARCIYQYDASNELLCGNNLTAPSISYWNKLLKEHTRVNQMQSAQKLFDEMPDRDAVSWNTMLAGFSNFKQTDKVYQYYQMSFQCGLRPTAFTISIVITSVLGTKFNVLIPQLHAYVVSSPLSALSVYVGSALLRGYTDIGDVSALGRVFDEIRVKDVSSWNALVFGYMTLGLQSEALRAFKSMPDKNIISWTTLVDAYVKNKDIKRARDIFDQMVERNVVSWTVMISGYAQNGKFLDAMELFLIMLRTAHQVRPNSCTYSSMFDACADESSFIVGMQLHSRVIKSGLAQDDVILSTSILDMYAKCGNIDSAYKLFESMAKKNLVSWNSLLGGYARHGLGTRALQEFKRMKENGIKPDQVTLLTLLSACTHEGLVEEGVQLYESMGTEFGIEIGMKHYACMVNLYGKAGQLEKAVKVIQEMPFKPDVVVWGALLGACGSHSSLQLGELAALGISNLKKDHPAIYSLLSKIHGEKGTWTTVCELRKLMNDRGARKQNAGSWVESIA
uniref:Pentatricopeptide repeat-containing protein n=1 Tax=Kalanchoe fedtschenkoi TaxID=63787 RepID=A0A7N1A2D3_KALFE